MSKNTDISVNLLGCTPSHEALLPPPSALLLCHGHSHRWTRPLYKGGDHHVNIAGVEPQHQPQLNRARSRGSSASSHRVCPSAADTPQCDCSEEPPGLVVACNRFLSLHNNPTITLYFSAPHLKRSPAYLVASSTTCTASLSPPCLPASTTCQAGSSPTSPSPT